MQIGGANYQPCLILLGGCNYLLGSVVTLVVRRRLYLRLKKGL
jgi:hypothetical protein